MHSEMRFFLSVMFCRWRTPLCFAAQRIIVACEAALSRSVYADNAKCLCVVNVN